MNATFVTKTQFNVLKKSISVLFNKKQQVDELQ